MERGLAQGEMQFGWNMRRASEHGVGVRIIIHPFSTSPDRLATG